MTAIRVVTAIRSAKSGPADQPGAVIVSMRKNGPVVEIEAVGYEADPAQRSQ